MNNQPKQIESDDPLWDLDDEYDVVDERPAIRKMRRGSPVNEHHDFQRRTENRRNYLRKDV